MSIKPLLRRAIGGGLRSVLGRKQLYRFSRTLMNEARLDFANDPNANGEREAQEAILNCFNGRACVVFDVGANVGDWTRSLLGLAEERQISVSVHAFEPSLATSEILRRRLSSMPRHLQERVQIVPKACSSRSGEAYLNIVENGCGRNSLVDNLEGAASRERIELTTIDEYCEANGIRGIEYVKIDAEGHDFDVLLGASRMMRDRAIQAAQFEYNHRWIHNRHHLRDVFELCGSTYAIGKITPFGVEFCEKWNWEMESFQERNYLLMLPELVSGTKKIASLW